MIESILGIVAFISVCINIWAFMIIQYHKENEEMFKTMFINNFWEQLEADRKKHAMSDSDDEWELNDFYNLLHILKHKENKCKK